MRCKLLRDLASAMRTFSRNFFHSAAEMGSEIKKPNLPPLEQSAALPRMPKSQVNDEYEIVVPKPSSKDVPTVKGLTSVKGGDSDDLSDPELSLREKRAKTWKVLLVIFSVAIIVVTILMIVGIALMIKSGREKNAAKDAKNVESKTTATTTTTTRPVATTTHRTETDFTGYRTIGSICGISYKHAQYFGCIFESENNVGKCDGDGCVLVTWILNINESTSEVTFERHEENIAISGDTNKAHCGEKKMCNQSSCVSVNDGPWKNPIMFEESSWKREMQSPCIRAEGPAAIDSWRNIAMTQCDQHEFHCSQGHIAKAIKASFQQCVNDGIKRPIKDKSAPAPIGRKKPCAGPPVKIYDCKTYQCIYNATEEIEYLDRVCKNSGGEKANPIDFNFCYVKCWNGISVARANGAPCKLDGDKDGYCLERHCYELSTDEPQSP